MDDELFQWKIEVHDCDGVIVGCCQNQEWLLPWWWMHFRMHNEYPVTFFDFGDMSSLARNFCSKRGGLVNLAPVKNHIVLEKNLTENCKSQWESEGVNLNVSRSAWFKKPFACLQSPYKRTLWIDLDCQIRKSIEPIFEFCENSLNMAIAAEPDIIQLLHQNSGILCYGEIEYNTGVIVFKHGCNIIQKWAKMCLQRNDSFRGDQEALSRMAFENDLQLPLLLPIHNCRELDVKSVIIFHWLGGTKNPIRKQIELLESKCNMDFSLSP